MKKVFMILILAFAASVLAAGTAFAGGRITKTTSGYEVSYFITDHLGSTRAVVSSSGTVIGTNDYYPFGKLWESSDIQAPTTRYLFSGKEQQTTGGINYMDFGARMYDDFLGRWFVHDPMSESYYPLSPYAYCGNNPVMYRDYNGEWFGIDDLIVAAAGFVIGYVSHGISTGHWGAGALQAGAMGAVGAWLGFNTLGAGMSAWNYVGNMAVNTAANQIFPAINIPMGNHFGFSVSPAFGLGSGGFTGGISMTGYYADGDFRIGAGIGFGDNYWGWNASATYAGWGGGYGQTTYDASEVMGQQFDSQRVGTYTALWDGGSFSISNDLWGDKQDRWRTSAAELTVGRFSVGTYLYTNWGKRASGEEKDKNVDCIPPWPVGKHKHGLGSWTNGRPYFAPLWIGYRSGNQITRIGFSHKAVHNMTQNMVHKYMDTPYYMSYDDFKRGGYFYSGYNNPFSLWDR